MQIEGEWKMDIATITGMLISGFATRIYGAGMAIWVAVEASAPLTDALGAVNTTLAAVNSIN